MLSEEALVRFRPGIEARLSRASERANRGTDPVGVELPGTPNETKLLQNLCWWDIMNVARTHFERNC